MQEWGKMYGKSTSNWRELLL